MSTYLGYLKSNRRGYYYIALVFIAATLTVNLARNEVTPFFMWAMYSGKTPKTDSFSFFELQYNNNQVFEAPHTWKDHKRMMFFYTMEYYAEIKDKNGEPDRKRATDLVRKLYPEFTAPDIFASDSSIENYPAWLKRYMQDNTGIRMDSIKVYRKWAAYDKEGRVHPGKAELLCKG